MVCCFYFLCYNAFDGCLLVSWFWAICGLFASVIFVFSLRLLVAVFWVWILNFVVFCCFVSVRWVCLFNWFVCGILLLWLFLFFLGWLLWACCCWFWLVFCRLFYLRLQCLFDCVYVYSYWVACLRLGCFDCLDLCFWFGVIVCGFSLPRRFAWRLPFALGVRLITSLLFSFALRTLVVLFSD